MESDDDTTVDRYASASVIARIALGKKIAVDDPLAWWLLTEIIAERA